jgi:hypothetical protein
MKYLIIIFLCTANMTGTLAQTFEGTMTWSSKSDIKMSDKQVQQMKEAKKQMETQMNNPEFKKQMEQNPAIKEMMEKQMKMMESMDGENSFNLLPEKMVTKVKGKNTCTIMSESSMIIYQGDKNKTYSLDKTNKTYTDITTTDNKTVDPKINISKTTETATINGYNCIKYILTNDESSGPAQWLWVTKDIKDIDPTQFAGSGKVSMNWFFKEVDGFPVKLEINTPQGKMYSELTELKRVKLPDSDFQIPADYKKK